METGRLEAAWRDFDRAALDREYNARESVADYAAELRRWVELSAQARADLRPELDIVFDPALGTALDWFVGAPGGPVLLWIHGGFWRAIGKAEQSLAAPGLVAAGIHVAVMDYRLAPAATLDEIVGQVRLACRFVTEQAAARNADPSRVFAAGHSAGGQLVGMLLAEPGAISGGITLSGIFDLEPIRHSYVDEWLHLDPAAVQRLSPRHRIPTTPAPKLLASYGGAETAEFRRQTEDYVAAWRACGHDAHLAPQPERHHFDLVVGFGDAADPLCRAAVDFIRTE